MTKNFFDIDGLGYLKATIIIAIAITGYLLLLRWQADYVMLPGTQAEQASAVSAHKTDLAGVQDNNPTLPKVVVQENQSSQVTDTSAVLPKVNLESESVPAQTIVQPEIVTVTTDVFSVDIQLNGADLYKVGLSEYPIQLGSMDGFELLSSESRRYTLQSGVLGVRSNLDIDQTDRPTYRSAKRFYNMGDAQQLVVPFTFENDNLIAVKSYIFERGSYQPKVKIEITNKGSEPWSGVFFGQILRDGSADPSAGTGGFGLPTFNGAAYWAPEKRYNKLTFKDLSKDSGFKATHTGGWVAWVQHYFLSAWILDPEVEYNLSGRNLNKSDNASEGLYVLSATNSKPTVIAPGQTANFSAGLYMGPKIEEKLATVAEGLNLAVDYGFLFMISKLLFQLLSFIHDFVGNWGLSIILLTVFVKSIFLWPSAISYRSMAKMRKLAPELARMKERFGDDRQRMSQEMMKFYKKEKVNPFGGCLPVLLQMPVFFALYWTLLESVELRQTPFVGWIQDLSTMDPYFILPLLMGVSMFVQTSLNPVPPDPTQAKVMKLMPIMFTVFFLFFPSGLVLYWLTNNILSIAQQWYITKRVEA